MKYYITYNVDNRYTSSFNIEVDGITDIERRMMNKLRESYGWDYIESKITINSIVKL